MSVFAEEAAKNMQSAFADFLFDPLEDGFEGMLKSFSDTLRRMAAEVVAAQLADYFNFEDWFKVGAGGKLGDIFGGGAGRGTVGTFPGPTMEEAVRGAGGGVLAPIDITAQRMPELFPDVGEGAAGTALTAAGTTVATALTTAGTTSATALTTASTTAATAFTTSLTAATTALTAAGTTVAGAITAAGSLQRPRPLRRPGRAVRRPRDCPRSPSRRCGWRRAAISHPAR